MQLVFRYKSIYWIFGDAAGVSIQIYLFDLWLWSWCSTQSIRSLAMELVFDTSQFDLGYMQATAQSMGKADHVVCLGFPTRTIPNFWFLD
jgi:hypothetical protein